MTKYKTRQNETFLDGLFPQVFPTRDNDGETNRDEQQMDYNPEPLLERDQEPQQPTLNEIWEWLGNPDKY